MPKSLTPLLAAFGVAFVVGFLFAQIGDIDTSALLIAAVAGGLTFIVMFSLSGNRAIANADAATRQRALAFEVWPDKTALYLVRTGFIGMAAGMDVAVDGKPIAQLKSPRFTRLDIAPGAHTLTASFVGGLTGQTKPIDFQFTGAPSEVVVLKLSMSVGALKNPVQIERVSRESVQMSLQTMQMTAADVGEL